MRGGGLPELLLEVVDAALLRRQLLVCERPRLDLRRTLAFGPALYSADEGKPRQTVPHTLCFEPRVILQHFEKFERTFGRTFGMTKSGLPAALSFAVINVSSSTSAGEVETS